MDNERLLTQDEQDILIYAFENSLKQMASREADLVAIGFVSLSIQHDIPTDVYSRTRHEDSEFSNRCERCERDLANLFGEVTIAKTVSKGRPQDQIKLAGILDPRKFGEKESALPPAVQLIKQMTPEDKKLFIEKLEEGKASLVSSIKDRDSRIARILEEGVIDVESDRA